MKKMKNGAENYDDSRIQSSDSAEFRGGFLGELEGSNKKPG